MRIGIEVGENVFWKSKVLKAWLFFFDALVSR